MARGGDAIHPEHWEKKAKEELAAARALAGKRLWSAAYYHAGMAIEFAIKWRIMHASRMNRWPSRQERRDLYSHDLTALAALAGLEHALLDEIAAGTDLGTSWLVAKDWSIETRYDPRPFPPREARDMLRAVDTMGLLKWLLTP
jgi:HEPN domain-containing protein